MSPLLGHSIKCKFSAYTINEAQKKQFFSGTGACAGPVFLYLQHYQTAPHPGILTSDEALLLLFVFSCRHGRLVDPWQDFQEVLAYLFGIIPICLADEVQAIRCQDSALISLPAKPQVFIILSLRARWHHWPPLLPLSLPRPPLRFPHSLA